MGGFGGADGLRACLLEQKFSVVIDATHPFAANISRNAHQAVQQLPILLLRFERPAWTQVEGDQWTNVTTLGEASACLPSGAKAFLTTGRKDLQGFISRNDLSGVIRTVEPPAEMLPSRWRLLLDRPPHSLLAELALFKAEGFTHVVTKNAGGYLTKAKLDAARALKLPVFMMQRPHKPTCEVFDEIPSLIKRLGT